MRVAVATLLVNFTVCSAIVYIIAETQTNRRAEPDLSSSIVFKETCGNPIDLTWSTFVTDEGILSTLYFTAKAAVECNYAAEFFVTSDEKSVIQDENINFSLADLQGAIQGLGYEREIALKEPWLLPRFGPVVYSVSVRSEFDTPNAIIDPETSLVVRDHSDNAAVTEVSGVEAPDSKILYPTWETVGEGSEVYGTFVIANAWFLEKSNAISVVLSGILGAILSQYFNRETYVGVARFIRASWRRLATRR